MVDARLAIRGIEEHVGKPHLAQVAAGERADLQVGIGADPGDLGLGDPGVSTQRLDQVVDLPGRDPVQISLHHDREQCLVDPAPSFQQRREERSPTQLWDPELQVPGRRRQSPRMGSVTLRGAVAGAFVLPGADHRRGLGVDQLLVERLGDRTDPVRDVGELQLGQQVNQGRLVKSHRALCPLVRFLDSSH